MHRLLFVCSGNICRSPMAEALARRYAERRGWRVETRSGGTLGIEGEPAAEHAVRVMREIGLDISGHRSRPVRPEDVRWADHVLVMELTHQMWLHRHIPEANGKVLLLGTFAGTHEIPDPIGGWRFRFRRVRDLLERAVDSFMDHLPPPAEE